MRYTILILFFLVSAESYALFTGISTTDELHNMWKVAELQEELARKEGNKSVESIVKEAIADQKVEKENAKAARTALLKEMKAINSSINSYKKITSDLQKEMKKNEKKMASVEKAIEDKENLRAELKIKQGSNITSGIVNKAYETAINIGGLMKKYAGYGNKEVSEESNKNFASDLDKVQEDLDKLKKSYPKIKRAVALDKSLTVPQVKTFQELLEQNEAKLIEVTNSIEKFDKQFDELVLAKESMKLSGKAEERRITDSINALLKEIKCKGIQSLSDLNATKLQACKSASWKKAEKNAVKADKCKKIDETSGSVDIEYCLRAYMKSKN
jgi:hypothetical protein